MKTILNYRRYICLSIILIFPATAIHLPGADREAESLFWKIEKGDAVIYLLGSIHMAAPDFYPFPERVEEAFQQSDCLVLEVNTDDLDQMEMVKLISEHGLFRDGRKLSDVVPEKLYAALKAEFTRNKMDLASFEPMQPWMVGITLTALQVAKIGFQAEHGVDAYFLRNRGEREVLELETAAEQLSLFSGLDIDLQVMMLEDSLRDLEKSLDQIREMFAEYKKLNAAGIREILFDTIDNYPHLKPLYEKLLDDRNLKMAEKLAAFHGSGRRCFVVVGAAHLFGEKGLVELMRGKGYALTPK
jgi:uncharacterized protein